MTQELLKRAYDLTQKVKAMNKPLYDVSSSYKRFNQKKNMVMRYRWDDQLQYLQRQVESRIEKMHQNVKGYTLEEYALVAGASVGSSSLGTGINRPNAGLTAWEEIYSDPAITKIVKPKIVDSDDLTERIKTVAQYFGADLVGIAHLDRRWVYSHHYIPETQENPPITIPEEFKYVIAMGIQMDYERVSHAPNAVMQAETSLIYSKMALLLGSLATYIRSLGYQAIPSLNDTALNVPIAIDAGLGQVGRHGLLITPQFGPRQRLCKVITDMPLKTDKPIDFGVTKFCDSCDQCARHCPSQAISHGKRTMEKPTISNNAGVLKWYIHPVKCREFWLRNGTNCGICIKVCPFNQRRLEK